jgi:hypothetical protein
MTTRSHQPHISPDGGVPVHVNGSYLQEIDGGIRPPDQEVVLKPREGIAEYVGLRPAARKTDSGPLSPKHGRSRGQRGTSSREAVYGLHLLMQMPNLIPNGRTRKKILGDIHAYHMKNRHNPKATPAAGLALRGDNARQNKSAIRLWNDITAVHPQLAKLPFRHARDINTLYQSHYAADDYEPVVTPLRGEQAKKIETMAKRTPTNRALLKNLQAADDYPAPKARSKKPTSPSTEYASLAHAGALLALAV